MTSVLVATDSAALFHQIESILGSAGTTLHHIDAGRLVRPTVIELQPDVVVLDMQIGSMGGIAASIDLRLEESGSRLEDQRIVLLLDRDADAFLGGECGADVLVRKPLDPRRLQQAIAAVLADEPWSDPVLPV